MLREGCHQAKPALQIQIIHDEVEAVRRGLEMLEKDDLLVVFYEMRKPIESLLKRFYSRKASGNRCLPEAEEPAAIAKSSGAAG